jgi:hypothetical protein
MPRILGGCLDNRTENSVTRKQRTDLGASKQSLNASICTTAYCWEPKEEFREHNTIYDHYTANPHYSNYAY